MRMAAVRDCRAVLDHYGIDLTKARVLEVGGTEQVWLLDGRKMSIATNPLLSLCPDLTFLDRGFNVESLRTRADELVDFLDLRAITHLQDQFDVALSFDTLEHVSNPFRFCEHLVRVTKPGGYVWVSTVFSFQYHPSPEDNFRYSPTGLRHCFLDNANSCHQQITIVWSDWETDKLGVSVLVHKGMDKHFGEPFKLPPAPQPIIDRVEDFSIRTLKKAFSIIARGLRFGGEGLQG